MKYRKWLTITIRYIIALVILYFGVTGISSSFKHYKVTPYDVREVKMFNAQFEQYIGTGISKASVLKLLGTIEDINLDSSDIFVEAELYVLNSSGDFIKDEDEGTIESKVSMIKNKKFVITLTKNGKGLVSVISIYPFGANDSDKQKELLQDKEKLIDDHLYYEPDPIDELRIDKIQLFASTVVTIFAVYLLISTTAFLIVKDEEKIKSCISKEIIIIDTIIKLMILWFVIAKSLAFIFYSRYNSEYLICCIICLYLLSMHVYMLCKKNYGYKALENTFRISFVIGVIFDICWIIGLLHTYNHVDLIILMIKLIFFAFIYSKIFRMLSKKESDADTQTIRKLRNGIILLDAEKCFELLIIYIIFENIIGY